MSMDFWEAFNASGELAEASDMLAVDEPLQEMEELAGDASVLAECEETARECWEMQHTPKGCAVAAQCVVMREFGIPVDQDEQLQLARDEGIYRDETGTILNDVGLLLEKQGIPVQSGFDVTTGELQEHVRQGNKVIVAVNADGLYDAAYRPGRMDRANHVVQFVGLEGEGEEVRAVLNDSVRADGCCIRVPLSQFEAARSVSDGYALVARRPAAKEGGI